MKILLTCFVGFVLVCPTSPAFAAEWEKGNVKPHIAMEYTVTLSSAMLAAIEKFDPDFKPWEARSFTITLRGIYEYKSFRPDKNFLSYQTPSVVIADFNGDGLPDAAMLGHNKTFVRRLVLLSSPKGYSVMKFDEDYTLSANKLANNALEEYLEYVAPKKIRANPSYERPELDLKNDAFMFGVFEKFSDIYIFKESGFVNYVVSD